MVVENVTIELMSSKAGVKCQLKMIHFEMCTRATLSDKNTKIYLMPKMTLISHSCRPQACEGAH